MIATTVVVCILLSPDCFLLGEDLDAQYQVRDLASRNNHVIALALPRRA